MSKLRVLLLVVDNGGEVTTQLKATIKKALSPDSFEFVNEQEEHTAELLIETVSNFPNEDRINRKRMNLYILRSTPENRRSGSAQVIQFNTQYRSLVAAAILSLDVGKNDLPKILQELIRNTLTQYQLLETMTVHQSQLQRLNITNVDQYVNLLSGYNTLYPSTAALQVSFIFSEGVTNKWNQATESGLNSIKVSMYGESNQTSKTLPNIVIVPDTLALSVQKDLRNSMAKATRNALNRVVYVFSSPNTEIDVLLQEGLDLLNNRSGLLQWALSADRVGDVREEIANFSTLQIESLIPTAQFICDRVQTQANQQQQDE